MTSGVAESSLNQTQLDQLSINTLRLLAVDEVQKANSGHPGAPLGCAPIAYLLFHKLMKHNPGNSTWPDRDRFVLSGDNLISRDGPTELSYNDDVLERFEAYHWHTQRVGDGNDLKGIEAAI